MTARLIQLSLAALPLFYLTNCANGSGNFAGLLQSIAAGNGGPGLATGTTSAATGNAATYGNATASGRSATYGSSTYGNASTYGTQTRSGGSTTASGNPWIAAQKRSIAALSDFSSTISRINSTATANAYAPRVQAAVDEYRSSLVQYKSLGQPTGSSLEEFKQFMRGNMSNAESVAEATTESVMQLVVNGFYNSAPLKSAILEFRQLR